MLTLLNNSNCAAVLATPSMLTIILCYDVVVFVMNEKKKINKKLHYCGVLRNFEAYFSEDALVNILS